MSSLFGIKVIANPLIKPQPMLQLSHDFNAVSPEFKARFNAWLLERFGTYEPMYIVGATRYVSDAVMVKLSAIE